MGIKRTTAHISEHFMWNGVVKDVKEMVSATLFLSFKYTLTEQECFTRYGIIEGLWSKRAIKRFRVKIGVGLPNDSSLTHAPGAAIRNRAGNVFVVYESLKVRSLPTAKASEKNV